MDLHYSWHQSPCCDSSAPVISLPYTFSFNILLKSLSYVYKAFQ